ncbi:TerB family tellurite resistance protein [Winogradskyella sp. 4-2091]|uniref:tellurite resistance TerB family protein n=1 Tax=Winogradskyella sp. 4-2091 TaxID=3381659 RepID=UPI003892B5D0
MSFSNLFDSGFKKRNKNHFASIVKVAMSDGVITDTEKLFLDRLATRLDITEHDYKEIVENYGTHPLNAPLSYETRLERLYDLARMVWADDIQGPNQHSLLEKLCVGLGFHAQNVKYIADKALALAHDDVDSDTFIEEMKNMNR